MAASSIIKPDLCKVMNLPLMLELIEAAKLIAEKVGSKYDLIVLIGQSPAYLLELLKFQGLNVVNMAMSGKVYVYGYASIPSDVHLNVFFEYLKSLGITCDKLIQNKILFIDHSHSGNSVQSLTKLLEKYCNEEISYPFLNIVAQSQLDSNIIKAHSKYTLIMPSLLLLANEGVPRIVPSYTHLKWSALPNFDDESLNDGKICVKKLSKYYKLINLLYDPTIVLSHKDILIIVNKLKQNCDPGSIEYGEFNKILESDESLSEVDQIILILNGIKAANNIRIVSSSIEIPESNIIIGSKSSQGPLRIRSGRKIYIRK